MNLNRMKGLKSLRELNELFGTPSYVQIDLSDMIREIGEERTQDVLSYFSSPLNHDVERFLWEKALLFDKREYSKTTLVFWVSADGKKKELVGYFTVAEKIIRVKQDILSSKERPKLHGHGEFDPETKNVYDTSSFDCTAWKKFQQWE